MRAVRLLLVLTLFLGTVPFMPYGWARVFGTLTDADTWFARGGNHGPWRFHEPHQSLVMLPMLALACLPVLTFPLTVVLGIVRKRGTFALQGFGLCLLQWGLAFLQLATVFWTID